PVGVGLVRVRSVAVGPVQVRFGVVLHPLVEFPVLGSQLDLDAPNAVEGAHRRGNPLGAGRDGAGAGLGPVLVGPRGIPRLRVLLLSNRRGAQGGAHGHAAQGQDGSGTHDHGLSLVRAWNAIARVTVTRLRERVPPRNESSVKHAPARARRAGYWERSP